jgi:predicted PurR-regulated permease PerM
MASNRKSQAFTSFRIIGKKAQQLLLRANEQARSDAKKAKQVALPPPEETPEVTMRFSLMNVAHAALVILAIAIGMWMIMELKDKIILLLLAFFVAAIIDPGVRMMERRGIPRGIGVLVHYFTAVFLVVFLLVSLIPIIATQLQQIAVQLSEYVNAFIANPRIDLPLLTEETNKRLTELAGSTLAELNINQFTDALQSLGENMSSIASGSWTFATRIAGSVVNFFFRLIVVLVLAFFIQMEKEPIRTWVASFLPARYRNYMDAKTDAIHSKIGKWARGQLLLGLSIGSLVFVALSILGIPYAATLAVLAGFTEFIPYIGPFIAAIPAVLIAFTEGGFFWAAVIAGIYYIIQWCENNLLVPLIMKRAVGLSPIAIIFAMLVGVSFPVIIHPILGILLAVPVTTIIVLFLEDWRMMRQRAR